MELSLIIPVFNEELTLNEFYPRARKVLDSITADHEMIFINDGSKDRTLELLQQIASQDSQVKYIDLSRNFGHQLAVTAGLDNASGRRVCIIDADLQDPPELITALYNKMDEGFEVVYAKRNSREGETAFKKWTAKAFYRILKYMTTIDIPVDSGDFRIIDQKVVQQLRRMPERNKYIRGQIAWVGFRQTHVLYDRQERFAGSTGYNFRKMLRLALDGITSFSNTPLKFVTYLGLFISIIALLLFFYVLYSMFVLEDTVPGWGSLMVSILFLGGIQMVAIGIIGEYLSRMNQNLLNRPAYIVQDTNII